jgi:acetoacetate decarboxylase
MSTIRYGRRSDEERRNRELEATSVGIWANVLVATYETDPEVIAAVLPQPLEPGTDPFVRVTIASVEIGDRPPFGAGTIAVHARHEGTEGDYALVMPMTTEQAVIGGRETFGEPKKLGEVALTRNGDEIVGSMGRMGTTFVEVRGKVTGALPLPEDQRRTSFYFKFLLDPSGKGFDAEPSLVYCYRDEAVRLLEAVDGDVVLKESHFDPVADLPVRRVVDITYSERRSVQTAEIVSHVPAEWLLPFVHQRYDDLSPVGTR